MSSIEYIQRFIEGNEKEIKQHEDEKMNNDSNFYTNPTITAETYEQSVEIEKELLKHGFRFLKVEGKRMTYHRSTLRTVSRIDVYMKFWPAAK